MVYRWSRSTGSYIKSPFTSLPLTYYSCNEGTHFISTSTTLVNYLLIILATKIILSRSRCSISEANTTALQHVCRKVIAFRLSICDLKQAAWLECNKEVKLAGIYILSPQRDLDVYCFGDKCYVWQAVEQTESLSSLLARPHKSTGSPCMHWEQGGSTCTSYHYS